MLCMVLMQYSELFIYLFSNNILNSKERYERQKFILR